MSAGAVHEEEIRECVERVLASHSFAVSKRRSELLRYLIDRSIAGQAESITEYGIALDVFGKPPSFDPQRESTVRAEMSRLRRSLAEYYQNGGASDPWRLQCSNRGYALTALPNSPAPDSAPAVSQPAVRRWPWAAPALAVLVMSVWAVWQVRRPPSAVRAVIVLPFANLTGDPGSEYLADGLTEDLTDSLARMASLRVVARTSAFQFKGKAIDIREIGRRVDADAIVEGSIQRISGRLRVTVQVNRSADGYHILSRRFDGDPAELARIEHDLCLPVLAAIRPGATTTTGRNPNPQAYDLLLQARTYRGRGTREAFEKIIALVNRAINLDPEYADAYASLAVAYAGGATTVATSPAESVAKVKAAAARAIELDPASARAYAAEGYVDAMVQLDWKHGEDELRSAVRLMPQNATNHQWLGQALMSQGKFPEALTELNISENLDPLTGATGASVAIGYLMARQYDNMLRHADQVLQAHPEMALAHELLGEAWLLKGDPAKALSEYRILQQTFPDMAEIMIAHLYAVTGQTVEARQMLAKLDRADADPLSRAATHAALGEFDQAFQCVERAWEKRSLWILKVHPLLDPLRADPRYQVWLKRAGFVQ
jgi:TolB-like protein/tetratricopeptide (TPR) repeat protein